jgi:hypothetical protein
MQNSAKLFYPILTIFLIISSLIFFFKETLTGWGFNVNLMMIANAGLVLLNLLVLFLQLKSIKSGNPNRFVQAVMGGTLIKMLLFATAILIYAKTNESISRKSIYAALVFYLVYLVVEVLLINRLNKGKNA